MTTLDPLWALSPLDGRYREKTRFIQKFASEAALINYRLKVEAAWLLHLAEDAKVSKLLKIEDEVKAKLQTWAKHGAPLQIQEVKQLELTTNHDVKALEYFIRHELKKVNAQTKVTAWIHFACTSEDINNLAYALMLKDLKREVILPKMDRIIAECARLAEETKNQSMLARTHGQTASPTTFGKECAVFGWRFLKHRQIFKELPIEGKFNGAVGNFNAHAVALPDVAWRDVSKKFIEKTLGLTSNPFTTQIENHDNFVMHCQAVQNFNTVLIGFCRDIWGYISVGYIRQKAVTNEVGSSTMPHKVNPIDFENAEGNLGVANSFAAHFGEKLLISRWQRDLTDSTVLRNIGSMAGYCSIAYDSVLKGLGKIELQRDALERDLDQAWEVLGEAVQSVMRRAGFEDAYEQIKVKTRDQKIDQKLLNEIIRDIKGLTQADREYLSSLTPRSYIGLASELVDDFIEHYSEKGIT